MILKCKTNFRCNALRRQLIIRQAHLIRVFQFDGRQAAWPQVNHKSRQLACTHRFGVVSDTRN